MIQKLLGWFSTLVAPRFRRLRPKRSDIVPQVDDAAVERALGYPAHASEEDLADDRAVLDRVLGRERRGGAGDDEGPSPG